MTKQDLSKKVASLLADSRQRAETLAQHRKELAYDTIPRLITIDNLIIREGITLATSGISGAEVDENRRIELREKINELEKERETLLEENNLSKDFITPKYSCNICKDTGKLAGKSCNCAEKLAQKLRRDEINSRFPLALSNFENFSVEKYSDQIDAFYGISPRAQMNEVYRCCREYADHFSRRSSSLYLKGETGIGKTHLALAIANTALQKGFNVIYVSSQSLFYSMQKKGPQVNETIEALLKADLLVLDDLGTELVNAFVISTLYNIVDTRMGNKLPTVYTTNILEDKLLHARYTEKISSRLLGGCEVYMLLGDDLRLV